MKGIKKMSSIIHGGTQWNYSESLIPDQTSQEGSQTRYSRRLLIVLRTLPDEAEEPVVTSIETKIFPVSLKSPSVVQKTLSHLKEAARLDRKRN